MTPLLARLQGLTVAHATGALVTALIAVDLFAGASGASVSKAGSAPGVVQNYVLFTTVTDGSIVFTTGTQFVSTTDRHIASQWCYMARPSANDALDPHVTVAAADAAGTVVPIAVAGEALARFGIDAGELDGLAGRNCRFQKDG